MKKLFRALHILSPVALMLLTLGSCLENDIPYPVVPAAITAFEVEDMEGLSRINTATHTVTLVVGDSVDLRALRLTRLGYTSGAVLTMADSLYAVPAKFPQHSWADLSELPMSADTRLDLRQPADLCLTTYQPYHWTVIVTRHVQRRVAVEGQVGPAVIDPVNRQVVIYVTRTTSLAHIRVHELSLGGRYGDVVPRLTDAELYPDGCDFRQPVTVQVRHGWEEVSSPWRVFVYHGQAEAEGTVTAFARTVSATVSGYVGVGVTAVAEYREVGGSTWHRATDVSVLDGMATAQLLHLTPATTYEYRLLAADREVGTGTLTTTAAQELPGGLLDDWHQQGKVWNPWPQTAQSYWDTGNRGATTISESNSVPTTDTWNGQGRAALLESKYLVLKFAAGNLFTGSYVATDGTNGVLDFGRPFTAFPTHLRFHYKYQSSAVNRVGDGALQWLRGRPDSCSVYVVLADWEQPFTIRTRPSERSLLDPATDPHILAYSVMETSASSSDYQQVDLPIHYRVTDRAPRYIVVVASASKYGDYFTGGDTSRLWVDDFELVYE